MDRNARNLAAAVDLLAALQQNGHGNTISAQITRTRMMTSATRLFRRAMALDSFGWLTGLSIAEVDAILAARLALGLERRASIARLVRVQVAA